jgi:acetyl-CoA carboxylase beta subunit
MTAEHAATARTGPRAVYGAIVDAGSMRPFGGEIEAGNPSDWPGYDEQLGRARAETGARHAVTTAAATVRGEPCVLIGFEFLFMGGSMGVAEGARIARAFAVAVEERLPVLSVAASGGSRMQEGTSALLQMQAIAAAMAAARRAGIPHIAVACDPTTGGVWASLVAAADVAIGIPGARVSFSGTRTRPASADRNSPEFQSDGKWSHGFLDALSPVPELRGTVASILRLLSPQTRGASGDHAPLPGPPVSAGEGGPEAGGWQQVQRARSAHPELADRWLAGYFERTFEIRGDRSGGVDAGVRCGFGGRDGATIAYIAQTGQATAAAGFRTATRLLTLAMRFGLPVLTLIDTPGAAAAPDDEAAGVGSAIAELFVAVASCSVPVTSVIIGEGVSGGALALASPVDLWLAPSGYLAVTAPELAASILKLPSQDVPLVAGLLRLTPAELLSRGIIRGVVQPPAASSDRG